MTPQENPFEEDTQISPGTGAMTPREIVHKQISDPDYHVTEKDLDEMIISDQPAKEQETSANKEADSLVNDRMGTSYDVLDES